MTDKTKLLKMVEDAINRSPDDEEIMARFVIDATADWFEEVLDQIGITPSCIPTLLRYQSHQHEYLNDDWDKPIPEGVDPYNLTGRDPTQSVWKDGKRPSPDYYELWSIKDD
jgi:hypothetical protein